MAVDYTRVGDQIARALSQVPNLDISYTTQITGVSSYDPDTGVTTGGIQTGSFKGVYLGEVHTAKPSGDTNALALTEFITVVRNLPTTYEFNSSTVFVIEGVEWSYFSHEIEPSNNAVFLKLERTNG